MFFFLSFQSIVQSLCDPTVSLMSFDTPFTEQHVSYNVIKDVNIVHRGVR